jgi:uncharacterized protein YifE (UPF0438 family)
MYQGEHDSKNTSDHDDGNSEESKNNQLLDINNNYKNANNEKETKEEEEENIHMSARDGDEYSEAFERFWLSYPRRIEKKGAYRAWKARLKEKIKDEDMISAALNYGKYYILYKG